MITNLEIRLQKIELSIKELAERVEELEDITKPVEWCTTSTPPLDHVEWDYTGKEKL